MHTCNCPHDSGVSSTVSSTSSDPAYFSEILRKLKKSEDLIDDSLYTYIKAKVHISDIIEKLEIVRDSGAAPLTPEHQTDLAKLIRFATNSGLVPMITEIEKLALDLKNRI